MFTLMCFLFSVLSLAIMNDAFDVGFTSETPDVNTYDKMPPRKNGIKIKRYYPKSYDLFSRVDVEYDPVRSIGNPIKVFDNSGTLHLKKPNDYSELATTEP
ncbi:hypothetical protein, conserved [Eimeria tenella]|uniref:Uncharacterized protein n=1 Tax=Eimeria tenella TaxID=5802 RepID=U6KL48_EIMTE|nr:hypothetical protein, conserved [Eimeria tenella]CDJ37536.1 hypothetical protein, conserved [Eimeria tenella]|eukprot:XP_013228374.1 hypothetical protein, conserved [Eimeria tenella]